MLTGVGESMALHFSGVWVPPMNEVTRILSAVEQGDPHAANQLLPLVYEELRKLAAQKMAQEAPGQTLQPTALTLRGATASPIACAVFSPDAKRLASGGSARPGSGPGALKIWHAQTGKELLALKGHSANVTTLSYSADGRRLASGSEDKTVKVWDAQTGQELLTFKGHSDLVSGVAFSPDGKHLASGSRGPVLPGSSSE